MVILITTPAMTAVAIIKPPDGGWSCIDKVIMQLKRL